MSIFKVKQVNTEVVEPVKFVDVKEDKRPIKGAAIFPEIYCNIFFCARKKSGKTCAIAKIIEKCASTETRVIAFVSTLYRDATWKAIQEMCAKKGIDFTGFTSLKDGKQDILEAIMNSLGGPDESKEDTKDRRYENPIQMGVDASEKKKKKPKELAPEIIFIFDDLSGEIKLPSIAKLLKANRHYKCKTLISSQYWNDIELQGRKQIDYVLLYGGLLRQMNKLNDIYMNLDMAVTFETFVELYRHATGLRYNFLYVDVVGSKFRQNFTHSIEPEEEDDRDL
jgi:hypothetical protein